MAKGYRLSEDSVRRIQQRNREHDQMYAVFAARGGGGFIRDIIVGRRLAWVGGTAITAASGSTIGSSTAGSGTVTFVYLDADNSHTFEYETDSDAANITQTVYNWTTTASGINRLIWVGQDVRGTWMFLNEAC